jgi:hypothetical protein
MIFYNRIRNRIWYRKWIRKVDLYSGSGLEEKEKSNLLSQPVAKNHVVYIS